MRWRVAPLRSIGLLIALGMNVGLLTCVAMQLTSDDSTAAHNTEWNANLTGSIANPANRRPIDSYGQILARPILFKSREPFVPPPPVPPSLAAPPPPVLVDPGLAVAGVMIKGGLSKAYLFSKAAPGGAWAVEGETVQGWKVKSIDGAGVRLEQTGRSIDLSLYPRD